MSTLGELGVLEQVEHYNIQGSGTSGQALRTTVLNYCCNMVASCERVLAVAMTGLNEWLLLFSFFFFLPFAFFKVIIGGLESCGDIVSVSCSENEIFILKGDRDIMRISNCPEGLISNSKTFCGCSGVLSDITLLNLKEYYV